MGVQKNKKMQLKRLKMMMMKMQKKMKEFIKIRTKLLQ